MPEESQSHRPYDDSYLDFLDKQVELDDEVSDTNPVEFSQFEEKAFGRWAAPHVPVPVMRLGWQCGSGGRHESQTEVGSDLPTPWIAYGSSQRSDEI